MIAGHSSRFWRGDPSWSRIVGGRRAFGAAFGASNAEAQLAPSAPFPAGAACEGRLAPIRRLARSIGSSTTRRRLRAMRRHRSSPETTSWPAPWLQTTDPEVAQVVCMRHG